MKLRTFFLLWISIFIFSSSLSAQSITITVSPNGDDKWDGTETAPLKTLQAARDKIRTLRNHENTRDTIRVIVKEGTYRLTETFSLGPRDGGGALASVVYEAEHGEKAIFSGGIPLEGFRELDNGLWAAHIPEVGYWNWTFDQLFVNGKRATRAKSPNQGYFYMKEITEEIWVQGTGRHPERARQLVVTDQEASKELSILTEEALSETIMTVFHKWNVTKRHIDKYDTMTHTIYTSGEGMKPWNPWTAGKRFILENYLNALDTPGEWFLDKDGTLYYMPFPDQKIETTTFVAPVLEQLLRIEGNVERGNLVENVIFRNLHFQHAANYLPREGFEPYQAAITIDAAIELNGTNNISFFDCSLEHTGGYGIWMNQGVSNSNIIRCYIHDLGAGGVRIGEIIMRDEAGLQTHSNTIDNCIISSGGFDFPTAVGVLIGHSANNQITHNDISDFRYTGVSVGWVWGYTHNPAKGNKILYNHIHHIGWGILSDMAGVYTLGISEGTEVSHNHVHHIYAYDYGGWGLYTDEGSSQIIMENNLVHHTKTGGFHQHYGRENILKNNIFAFSKMYQLQATRVEDHKSFSFTNNIVIYDRGVLFQGPWTKMQVEIDKNLYWNRDGQVDFNGNSLKNWRQNGYDLHSFIIDPQFINPESGNFTFKNLNATRKIGFKPFDYTLSGVYGSEAWKRKALLPESLLVEFDKLFE
jgi:hypothetical protein